MKELLGNHLSHFFHNTNTRAKNTYKGKDYEVWEVSDSTFKEMCNMSEEFFVEWGGDDAWWRSSEGCVLGVPDVGYEINGLNIIAWDGSRREIYADECIHCKDKECGECEATEEDIEQCFGERKYKSLSEYLCHEFGISQPKNVCACAMDLAKYNNMTMGELFRKYEGA